MTMTQDARMCQCFSHPGIELCQQDLSCIEPHKHTTAKQKSANTQSANALHLAIAVGESLARRLQRPCNSAECQEIGDEVGKRVVGIGDQSLRMKNIAANELANGHGEVGNQANSGDANASVIFVGRCQIYIVVVVVMVMAVTTMAPSLCHGERCYRAALDGARSHMREERGMGFMRRKGGEDAPLSRSGETGDPKEGVEGRTKPAPQGLRQRHHGLVLV